MKNVANFILWFMLVAGVLKSLFTKDAFDLKKQLPKYLFASIAINMSWFMMWALIDISNVATSAVWAFPQALLWENHSIANTNTSQEGALQQLKVSIPSEIKINLNNPTTWNCQTLRYDAPDTTLGDIQSRFNDMSGPLLFLGTSIYRFQSYCFLNQDISSWKNFSIGMTIKIIILLMFIAPLLGLLVVNFKRIFYLWVRIVFSPLILLAELLGLKDLQKKWWNIFDVKEIIGMIFTPVLTIWWLSLVLILSTSMYYVLWWTPWQDASTTPASHVYWWAEIISSKDLSAFKNTSAWTDITFEWDVFRDAASYAWWFIGYIIITSFTIMLLWAIVKMSVSGSKIASSAYNWVMNFSQKVVWSAQIIPVWWGKMASLSALANSNPVNTIANDINKKRADQSQQTINSTVWDTKIWKAMQNTYWFKVNEVWKDFDLSYWNNISENNIKSFMDSVKWTLDDDDTVKEISIHSKKFIKSAANKLIASKTLNPVLKTAFTTWWLNINDNDWKNITADKLSDTSSDIWKAFVTYLKLWLEWKIWANGQWVSPTAFKNLILPSNTIIYTKPKK